MINVIKNTALGAFVLFVLGLIAAGMTYLCMHAPWVIIAVIVLFFSFWTGSLIRGICENRSLD